MWWPLTSAPGMIFYRSPPPKSFRGIVTNPPYELATEFIERALEIIPADGFVAMLLRTDFDHAQSRRHLFADCPFIAKKLVLTKRIRWFKDSTASPRSITLGICGPAAPGTANVGIRTMIKPSKGNAQGCR
jgi:hypothetical protein